MAVERIKEFSLDLGELIDLRISNFINSRMRLQADMESKFQRSIVDSDLSFADQLTFCEIELADAQKEQFPDSEHINGIKNSISS